jgi:hypothetical protein
MLLGLEADVDSPAGRIAKGRTGKSSMFQTRPPRTPFEISQLFLDIISCGACLENLPPRERCRLLATIHHIVHFQRRRIEVQKATIRKADDKLGRVMVLVGDVAPAVGIMLRT